MRRGIFGVWCVAATVGAVAIGCGSDDGGSGSGGSAGTGATAGSSGNAGSGATGGGSGGSGATGGSSATGGSGGSAAAGGSPPGCGDSTIAGEEQCDDGNTDNLDGCDLQCRFELYLRANMMQIQSGNLPSWCNQTSNGLGSALSSTALGQVNDSLQSGIDDGGTNIIIQALGLDDPTGQSDSSLELGVTSGTPDPAAGAWPGNDPLDWSFLLQASTLDASGVPSAKLSPAAIDSGNITAGPSSILLSLALGGSPATLEILDAALQGRVNAATSTPSPPPDALAPGLSFLESVAANQANEGLCGNVTVASLANIPIPEALTTGLGACGQCPNSLSYTYCGNDQPVGPNCNSLLDAIVGGCRAALCLEVITPTQPNVKSGGPTLAPQGNLNKIPNAQTDGNKDAYSAYFRFTAKRQHASGKQ